MSGRALQTGSTLLGLPLTDVLPYFGTVVAALLGYFGARYTATAPLQTALNDAFRSLMEELQTKGASDAALILELRQREVELEAEIIRQRGELRQKDQLIDSLTRLCERNGLKHDPTTH